MPDFQLQRRTQSLIYRVVQKKMHKI